MILLTPMFAPAGEGAGWNFRGGCAPLLQRGTESSGIPSARAPESALEQQGESP